METAIRLPLVNQVEYLQTSMDEYIGALDIPITNISLTSGNLQNILYTSISDNYIKYATKNGICQIDFSLFVKPNVSSSLDASSNGDATGVWVDLPIKMPKPLITSRGQAVPVNSSVMSSANLRVDTDGSIKILINNYNSSSECWLQNTMCYVLGEQ